jgi:hypothetical protein
MQVYGLKVVDECLSTFLDENGLFSYSFFLAHSYNVSYFQLHQSNTSEELDKL